MNLDKTLFYFYILKTLNENKISKISFNSILINYFGDINKGIRDIDEFRDFLQIRLNDDLVDNFKSEIEIKLDSTYKIKGYKAGDKISFKLQLIDKNINVLSLKKISSITK